MESPMKQGCCGGNQAAPLRPHDAGFPGGGNRPAGSYQARSCSPSPIDFIPNLVPVPILEFVGQSAPAISDQRWKFFYFALLLFLQHQSQALLGNGAESGLFFSGDSLRALEQVIGDFNRCLHNMATHIRTAGRPYQAPFPSRELIFFRTASSIFISVGLRSSRASSPQGGQPRKVSEFSIPFFVASMGAFCRWQRQEPALCIDGAVNLYSPAATSNIAELPVCEKDVTPFALVAGPPLSRTSFNFEFGTQIVTVVFGGTTTCSVNHPFSIFQSLTILPRIESYSARANVRSPTGCGRMIKCLKPGAARSPLMPASALKNHALMSRHPASNIL